ncbi:DNA translocase FtsK [Methylobacterium radiodurans]|uniref:Cell division protein FtsK n=1 Tax=Methylobacterium radiodurans TaxID=2202828 RepID=A0A2U8VUL8_9HYPH|nr:DNA translocase FtsK [Methylobacterium radiodurans]AWN37088.1 cell division protein FtsK [Methylobacterium radiodurans]
MRASGRPPYSHRDPSRPGRGVDRPGLSLGALAHRLMSLRQSLTRRLGGAPRHPGYNLPRQGQAAAQSWATPPNAMLAREPQVPMPRVLPREMAPFGASEPRFGASEPRFGAHDAGGFGMPEAARAEPQGWPDHVFDDRAGFEPLPPRHESRIDHAASTPGVLVRQPRRPAAIAPEGVPADAYTSAPAAAPASAASQPSAVRFTRTPDTVLQERRQRALEAERAALERARAEAQAALQARADAQAAIERAEAERRAAAEEAARLEAERTAEAAAAAARVDAGPPVPLWRQPFVASEGVRYFRTPDRRPARPSVELSAEAQAPQAVYGPVAAMSGPEAALAPELAPETSSEVAAMPEAGATPACADFSDLPDWSGVQPWFGSDDGFSAAEAWAALDARPEAAPEAAAEIAPEAAPEPAVNEPAADEAAPYVAVPVDISHLRSLPPKPVYVLDRLVRFDMPPRPADLQDNASARAAEAAAAAFLPPRPALTLVFGPETPAPAGPSDAAVPAAIEPAPVPRPLRPALSAMAARAAIRPARQPGAPEPAPAEAPAFESAAVQVPFQMPVAAEGSAPVAVPIPARPVLLRGRAAPAPEPAEEIVEASEAVEAPLPSPAESGQAVAAEPAPLPAPVQGLVQGPLQAAPVNVPAVVRPHLIPAGRHLEVAAFANADYELPALELLALPAPGGSEEVDADVLEQNALNLQQTVQDFGVRGDILAVRPGPVVTLYELEPAPGTKSSRVIGLSDDIARSMSAVSARVAVVPGRNVIGIELPNETRETVYLRELLCAPDFVETKHKLALCLGKNIGGEPIIADLARMPHLLVAGTTGSGKSVAINTMILSLLYRMKPEECRLIMVDPKMLELSVYDGIPHLLSPVVIDPKKAVIALKWAVREMEERYKKMSKIAVRNIDGYNARMKEARERGETITRTVQTGFDRHTGEAVFEEEAMDLSPLPYIVIVVDEMADLMMVAGKDIEGAIQRLAQMARAAGIHLIMATQRPSVDVITGTIKANFPTRISFQVTSKIDSRTILGEMGAEQLLGQGDMLFMAGGGRTTRVHGPFCSDAEVESVVAHLKRQGRPAYLDAVTADDAPDEAPAKGSRGAKAAPAAEEREEEAPVFDVGAFAAAVGGEAGELYEQAIQVVLRDQKASTSYIQRRLQIGYNRAASLMERMEIEGIVGPANHAGKREILVDASHFAGSAIGNAMAHPLGAAAMDDED